MDAHQWHSRQLNKTDRPISSKEPVKIKRLQSIIDSIHKDFLERVSAALKRKTDAQNCRSNIGKYALSLGDLVTVRSAQDWETDCPSDEWAHADS